MSDQMTDDAKALPPIIQGTLHAREGGTDTAQISGSTGQAPEPATILQDAEAAALERAAHRQDMYSRARSQEEPRGRK
jgi:hypothetical protein